MLWERGSARFYVRNVPSVLELSAPKYLTERLSNVVSDREVVLKAGLYVRVVLSGTFDTQDIRVALVPPDKVLPPENNWVLDMHDADEQTIAMLTAMTDIPWFTAGVFDERRVARAPVGAPGEYAVCVYQGAREPGKTPLTVRALTEVEPRRFMVREGDWEPTFDLVLNFEAPR